MKSNQRQRRSSAEWQEIFANHRASGLSVRDYCAQSQIAHSTFARWRRLLDRAPAEVPEFVAVSPAPLEEKSTPNPGWTLELELGNGVTLRLRHPA